MSLELLAAAAVANNFTAGNSRTPIYELSIEDARAKVKIKDGNKKPKEDGSQALVLGFGKKNLPLDVIKAGATRVNATADQVEQYTTILQEAIDNGSFDDTIAAAQLAAEEAANAPKVVEETTEEEVVAEAPVGVDLDAL